MFFILIKQSITINVKHYQSKCECFTNLFGELVKSETNRKSDIFLFHFYKNIKQIQSDCLLFISNGLYKKNVLSKCFCFYKEKNIHQSKSECLINWFGEL